MMAPLCLFLHVNSLINSFVRYLMPSFVERKRTFVRSSVLNSSNVGHSECCFISFSVLSLGLLLSLSYRCPSHIGNA